MFFWLQVHQVLGIHVLNTTHSLHRLPGQSPDHETVVRFDKVPR